MPSHDRDGPSSGPAVEGLESRIALSVDLPLREDGSTDGAYIAVVSLVLIDADTDLDLMPLVDGMTLDLSRLPTRNLNVRADTGGDATGVRFGLDEDANFRTETGAPYALGGDTTGNYRAWRPTVGNHVLTATPLTNAPPEDLGGPPAYAMTVSFRAIASAPSHLVAAPVTYGQVDVAWHDNADYEKGVVLERSRDGVRFHPIATPGTNVTKYADTTAVPGVTYTYRATALAADGTRTLYSSPDDAAIALAAPAAPTEPAARAPSYYSVALTWKDAADNEQGFVIERSADGEHFAEHDRVGTFVSQYTDLFVEPDTVYYYRVSAYNSAGASAASSILTAHTLHRPPFESRPGPHNTGPTQPDLLAPSESVLVTTDGAAIENLDIAGGIRVRANNVTIRNVRIDGTGQIYGIKVDSDFVGTVVEDVEITGAANAGVFAKSGVVLRRLHIHHVQADAIKLEGFDGTLVEGSWWHHLGLAEGTHADGIQIRKGSNFVLRGNFSDMPKGLDGTSSNSAFIIGSALSPIDNILIEDNWLNGGNYTIYVLESGFGPPTNVRVTHNWFGRDHQFGVFLAPFVDVLWEENYWIDIGDVVLPTD